MRGSSNSYLLSSLSTWQLLDPYSLQPAQSFDGVVVELQAFQRSASFWGASGVMVVRPLASPRKTHVWSLDVPGGGWDGVVTLDTITRHFAQI